MTPTSRAQALHDPIARVMDTVATEVLSTATFNSKAARREFSLAMIDMAEVVFLPPLMKYLQINAPNCTLRSRRIPNEGIMDALEKGVVEMAVGNLPEAQGHIYSHTMFLHDYVVLASVDHPRLKRRLTWTDYRREQHIVVPSGSDTNLRENTLDPLGISRKVFLTVGGFLSVPWLIKDTELIATVPTRLMEGLATAAKVKQLPLPERAKPYGLQSVWHPRWHSDPGHRWLREALFHVMRSYPGVE
jgi:DNA-binding transcriptional LysR family regulator